MLRTISCTGFKSFDNFGLSFNPGLNILVGPNGSGKTNIILFLEFIGSLTRYPLIEAIGRLGGAGGIFRRKSDGTLQHTISFQLCGWGAYKDFRTGSLDAIRYNYSATIMLSREENTVIFSEQRIILEISPGCSDQAPTSYLHKMDIRFNSSDQLKPETRIAYLDVELIRQLSANRKDKPTIEDLQAILVEACNDTAKTNCILSSLIRFIRGADAINQDLFNARSYNINPTAVRRAEDIANEPIIQFDGSGLAATLYLLQTAKTRRPPPNLWGMVYPHVVIEGGERKLKEILERSKVVNDQIDGISVELDALESKLRIFINILYENKILKLPFGLVSDGTAKWLTLVTAIMTSENIFAIEEPENFLHPLMQAEIVRIVRDRYEEQQNDNFALMTTHSETIVNNSRPNELIIVDMKDGKTIVSRPTNESELNEVISDTGFGLGYYYIAGAIE
jgi:hypothetical protein